MKASARHILVKDEELCHKIKTTIESGAEFTAMAKKYSLCPSAERGGELGVFRKGMMVKEFDEVVFSRPLRMLHGPVKTAFGFHLIEILQRDKSHM
ncbi:peptidylprolyl isomerase [Kangiella shandongensis]|uniref:peptidylprolyl isomerase n=1 Tax=Kangiella shandongensis TaxID=2763258 RepID=UPI001CBE5F19|nr:peptidylprolyl isomerase [Kangiella shandongensis]